MMILLFLIGTYFIKNGLGKSYNFKSSNNCTQTFFDQTKSNYMAFFTFHSTLIDKSCPTAKAIAFKKNDFLEVEMKIQILNKIWELLNRNEKILLVTEVRNQFHFSCNNKIIQTELCRSNHALDGGIFISTYDGSLMKYQFQKSCSVCLLKSNINNSKLISKSDLSSPIIAYLKLSLSNIVNLYDSSDDEILSVKFVRSADKSELDSKYLLEKVIGKLVFNQSISISASLVYSIKVKSSLKKSNTKQNKDLFNASDNCVFRCDWSSICLKNSSLLCNNKKDCRYGDDENVYICQIFHHTNHKNREEIENQKTANSKLLDNNSQNKEGIPLILSIILLTCGVLSLGVVFLIYFSIKNKRSSGVKKPTKTKDFLHFSYDDPSFSSFYIHKSHLKQKNSSLSIDEMLLGSRQTKCIHSGKCNSSIHKKLKIMSKKNRLLKTQYLKKIEKNLNKNITNDDDANKGTNNNTSNKQLDNIANVKSSELCSQINYPDPVTKSSWLRSYFQMTKFRNQIYVKAPIVVNISKFSPMSFSYN